MNKKDVKAGDIFFIDSDKTGPKIVKFLMTAPNVFVHIFRTIFRKQEKVEYYHPGLFVSTRRIIEQQWKVEYKEAEKILKSTRPLIVFRRKRVSSNINQQFIANAQEDLGQKWGIVHTLFGRFPTWLTGIPLFARYIKLPNSEVSAGRVARWLYETFGETFGHERYTEATTHTMVKYMLAHPELYEVIYKR